MLAISGQERVSIRAIPSPAVAPHQKPARLTTAWIAWTTPSAISSSNTVRAYLPRLAGLGRAQQPPTKPEATARTANAAE
jgi:hypothetical protein